MVGDWVGCLWWVTGWVVCGVCGGCLGGVIVVGDWVECLWWVTGWGVCGGG